MAVTAGSIVLQQLLMVPRPMGENGSRRKNSMSNHAILADFQLDRKRLRFDEEKRVVLEEDDFIGYSLLKEEEEWNEALEEIKRDLERLRTDLCQKVSDISYW
eukprot:CAMPEP_0167758236 /NCGR_PEP_ID=MMETSP0110_2-20121227/10358_1 /TAXON_ID=629695 /ORGANISM="Gymnochlora sp., Strain CCMP2014" /LENGTH=102 /DNA_ID=CAMNT_0007644493 /DNA_START=1 /DNA_END=306 /DNA_ORIENTATION=+